ncbi:MAG: GNAT family N-acetyltransferase [Ignavibacteriae bacterium]|nr:GNAT family N-acetyltransferase [Ignavibacteriota bacterium]
MNGYRCLNTNNFEYGDYKITPVRKKDILKIKDWRNSQIDILRQKEYLTNKKQKEYFGKIIFPDFASEYPGQIIFSFLLNGKLIGYGGLVHINWEDRRAELSFLLEPDRLKDRMQYRKDFTAFLKLMKHVAYLELNFNRLYTETFDIRKHHISVLVANRFYPEGRMKKHVLIKNKFIDSLIHGNLKEYEKF